MKGLLNPMILIEGVSFYSRLHPLPNCLLEKLVLAKTFKLHVDNTSDHLLILIKLSLPRMVISNGKHRFFLAKQRIIWSKYSKETINNKYVVPLATDLAKISISITRILVTLLLLLIKLQICC